MLQCNFIFIFIFFIQYIHWREKNQEHRSMKGRREEDKNIRLRKRERKDGTGVKWPLSISLWDLLCTSKHVSFWHRRLIQNNSSVIFLLNLGLILMKLITEQPWLASERLSGASQWKIKWRKETRWENLFWAVQLQRILTLHTKSMDV